MQEYRPHPPERESAFLRGACILGVLAMLGMLGVLGVLGVLVLHFKSFFLVWGAAGIIFEVRCMGYWHCTQTF